MKQALQKSGLFLLGILFAIMVSISYYVFDFSCLDSQVASAYVITDNPHYNEAKLKHDSIVAAQLNELKKIPYPTDWWTDAANISNAPEDLSGTGTISDPYIVYTAKGLAYLVSISLNKNFEAHIELGADIDLAGHAWRGFCAITSADITDGLACSFSGSFDGKGHTISNMNTFDPAMTSYDNAILNGGGDIGQGLFSLIGTEIAENLNNGTFPQPSIITEIKNFTLENFAYCSNSEGELPGILGLAICNANVSNVKIQNPVYTGVGETNFAVGLYLLGFTNFNTVTLSGTFPGMVYGLGMFYNGKGEVKNCEFSGYCNGPMIGGGGGMYDLKITNCTNYSEIFSYYGGDIPGGTIFGYGGDGDPNRKLTITGCNNYGKLITKSATGGGIIGSTDEAITTILDCNNYGDLISVNTNVDSVLSTATNTIGGILGRGYANISNCTNSGNIYNGLGIGGGIVGKIITGNTVIDNCKNFGDFYSEFGNQCAGIANAMQRYSSNGTLIDMPGELTISNCVVITRQIFDILDPSWVIRGYCTALAYFYSESKVELLNNFCSFTDNITSQEVADGQPEYYLASWGFAGTGSNTLVSNNQFFIEGAIAYGAMLPGGVSIQNCNFDIICRDSGGAFGGADVTNLPSIELSNINVTYVNFQPSDMGRIVDCDFSYVRNVTLSVNGNITKQQASTWKEIVFLSSTDLTKFHNFIINLDVDVSVSGVISHLSAKHYMYNDKPSTFLNTLWFYQAGIGKTSLCLRNLFHISQFVDAQNGLIDQLELDGYTRFVPPAV